MRPIWSKDKERKKERRESLDVEKIWTKIGAAAAADVDVGGDGGAVAKEKREIPFHFEGDFQFWTFWPETGFGKQISKDGEVWQTLKQVNVSRLVKRNEKEKGLL